MGESSSEEEDANWKAAIESIAATTAFAVNDASASKASNTQQDCCNDGDKTQIPQKPKHYQIKAQKLLERMLDQSLEFVKDPPGHVLDETASFDDRGVCLFKKSPPGIVFDYKDEIQGPTKKPRILPRPDIDEKSKKKQIKAVAVDGTAIIAAACDAAKKSLARLEAKEAAIKEKARKEEERIAELKKIRGERWLPSIAREVQLNGKSNH